ncbi:MAG: hypothetical protein AAF225_14645 [Pseudomonadota bacterium]
MLEAVVLIDDEHWGKGPSHINPMIDLIVKQYEALQEVRRLKNQNYELQEAIAASQNRLHNNPPEAIANAAIPNKLQVLWNELDVAEVELEKASPNPDRLQEIAKRLLGLAADLAKYCGQKADLAISKAAEEIGTSGTKWAIRVGAGSLVAQTEGAQNLGKMLFDLAKTLTIGG